jgi:hypothetical protein
MFNSRAFGKGLRGKLVFFVSSAFIILFAVVPFVHAQETGQITGVVTDSTGAAVSGVVVTATNLDTNASRTATTSSTGNYSLIGLAPAQYQISTPATGGFQGYKAKAEVTVGGKLTFDITLSLGSATTEVQVSAEGGSQVNTTSQELSQVVDRQQISQLPSLTRNPYDFVALSGNISSGDNTAAGKSQNETSRGVGYSLNGQRSTGTEILLDGVENIAVFGDGVGITVPLDAVQEFSVTTSNFQPQYGRASGGIVNVTTRAGSNNLHGNVWEFNRLSAYTANTETNDALGNPKGIYTRNQFGGAVGGPILKDKLFFFASTEFTRVRSSASLTAAVPTSQFLADAAPNIQSYFGTYAGTQNFNFLSTSTNQQMGTASKIAPTPTNPSGLFYSNLPANLPVLGVVGYQAPADAGGGIPQNTYNITGRVDYNFDQKTQAFFRYVDYSETDTAGGDFASPYSQFNVGGTVKNQAYLLSVAHEFNPVLSSITKLSFSRFDTTNSYNTALQNTPTLFSYVNATDPVSGSPINLPGFYNQNPANGGLPFGGPQNTVQINQDLSLVKGKHTAQVGAQIIYIQDNNAYGAYAQAAEQLGNSPTQGLLNLQNGNLFRFSAAVNPNGALPCVADPYTGALPSPAPPSCSINLPASAPSFARSERFHDWAAYAQDAWKATSKATINYGVRYEYFGVQHNDNGSLDSNFFFGGNGTPTPANIRAGQVLTSPNSPVHGLWAPQYGTVSPRIGFAYDVFGNGKSSVRGGYGISYERNFGNVTFNVIQNPPNYAVIVINNTTVTSSNSGPLSAASGNVALPPTSLRNVSQNIRTSQTQFWSMAVEQQLAPNTVVSVEYTGSRGLHLYDIKNYNGVGSGNALLGDPVTDPQGRINPTTGNVYQTLTRLNPEYSDINNRGSNGDSYYHGMNVKFESRNLHHTGLSFVANYTLAHETDDLSTTFSETNNAFSLGYTDPFNPALDHGSGDFDIRHRFVFAPIYQTPTIGSSRSLLNEAFGGWRVTGIYTVRTGTPFTYFDTTNNVSGYNVARYTPANGVVPQHTFKSIPGGTAATGPNLYTIGALPAANSFGNPALLGASDWGPFPADMTARNAFRGPGAWNVDASLSKTFPIHEQVNLEFRAEGFDILNHHNLYILAVNNDVGNGNAIQAQKGGVAGGVNDERRFGQFALKVNF